MDADGSSGCDAADYAQGTFEGRIALIQRGSCSFAQKQSAAAEAGAVGAVLYHQVCDTLDKIDMRVFDANVKAIANAVGHYAWDTGELPDGAGRRAQDRHPGRTGVRPLQGGAPLPLVATAATWSPRRRRATPAAFRCPQPVDNGTPRPPAPVGARAPPHSPPPPLPGHPRPARFPPALRVDRPDCVTVARLRPVPVAR
ncbi:PA domain-containing protein [Streptomyces reniochalinae]